ncbi:MAG: HEAT repeat domain-containing protein [Planctomycetes bacterium]|nr:HEAT repeat domain-containing protein [Planctomycetota bacterium]
MRCLALCLALLAVAVAQQSVPAPSAADPLLILRELPRKADTATKVAALRGVALLQDDTVVALVQRHAQDEDAAVRKLAIQVLRYSPVDKAEAALVTLLDDHELNKDETLHAELLMALGQRGNPKMVKLLGDGIWDTRKGVPQARMLALSHIRCKESIDCLVDSLSLGITGGGRKDEKGPERKAINTALTSLSGESFATEHEWRQWWKAARPKFTPSATPRFQDDKQQQQWEKLWSNPFLQAERKAERKAKNDKGN